MIPGPWLLDPAVAHLNHGSFSAVPIPVLEAAERWRRKWEEDTTQFVVAELEPALDQARSRLAGFLGAHPENLVFVSSATAGVNAVVRSFPFRAGDQILTTDHVYNACRNVLEYVSLRTEAEVVVVPVPFPLFDRSQVVEPVLAAVTDRTRFALIDHVTSATGLVLPVEELVPQLEAHGVAVMIDGAHGPGMIPLQLERLGASFYTGNNHKWLSSPKGSGFLWVHPDMVDQLVPPVLSHGWNDPRTDRPRLHLLFDYQGSDDPAPHLAVIDSLDFLTTLHPQGIPGLMIRNRDLILSERCRLLELLEQDEPAPASMIGALATVPLPAGTGEPPPGPVDELARVLRADFQIQVPVFVWPRWPSRLLRISAAPYNDPSDYDRLLSALSQLL